MASALYCHIGWSPSGHSRAASARSLAPQAAASAAVVSAKPVAVVPMSSERSVVRIGLPSKGRMAEQTLTLLKVPYLSGVRDPVAGFVIQYLFS
jgi:hypothetical protein